VYDKKVVRRRRAVLGVLVALSIALLTIYFGESAAGSLHDFSRGAQAAFSPLEKGVSIVFRPVRNLANSTGDFFHAKKQNKQLKKEVKVLRQQLAQNQTAVHDANELRALTGLTKDASFTAGATLVTARVIERSPTVWYSNVVINRGGGDGIQVNDPVIAAGGLAGRVSAVTGGTARVTLITDESSHVDAEAVPGGTKGIVDPEVGNPDDMLLDYIQRNANIAPGQSVITSGLSSSGLGSLFPRGIPIGRVKRVDPSELATDQRVHIQPYANLRGMDYVQVLTGRAQELRAQVGP
jgi:rod shape-determining protein MreC